MSPLLRSAALLLLLGGCARPTEVELRLFPCGLAGATPVTVDLDVQGYDGAGTALAPLHASFAIAADVLGDGYATVGLRPPETMASADFTLTWRDTTGVGQVVTHAALVVPAVGEVLELGADMCVAIDGTSSGGTGTSEGTSSGSSTSSGTSTGGTGTDSGTGTSTSTGEGTSTSTGEGTSTGETTESSTTGEPSMVGEGCNRDLDQYHCENGGPGQLGTLLVCSGTWKKADLVMLCGLGDFCPAALGLVDPEPVGCSGLGAVGWACVCQDAEPQPCEGDEAQCVGNQRIDLCIDDGEGELIRTRGMCGSLCVDVDGPQCTA